MLFRRQFTKPMSVTLNDLCQFQRRPRALEWHHGIGGAIGGDWGCA
jgi:hypothetical protein